MSTSSAHTHGDDLAQSDMHQGSDTRANIEIEEISVLNAADKEKQRRNLVTHNVELRKSDTHGVGVFAIVGIPAGTAICNFNGPPSSRTIDWKLHEISKLPDHVQKTIKSFILPNTNGTYPIPYHGLACTLGTSWYINSVEKTGKVANVEFGNKKDESGYTEIVSTRFIECNEELLLPYKLEDSARCMTTIDGTGRRDNLPENILPCCRVCLKDFPVNARADVVDIGCKCRESSMMCRGCAVKWFTARVSFHFTQHRPDDSSHNGILNQWTPDVSVECELCRQRLSPSFVKILLSEAAASKNATAGVIEINKNLAGEVSAVPVALKISRIPGITSIPVYSGSRCGRRIVTYHHVHERQRYSNLGKRSRRSMKEVEDLRAPFIWQPHLSPGRFNNKTAQFWMSLKNQWVNGKIHEYVSAEERNDCKCALAVCTCPKYSKGMYRYTTEGEEGYFSDDDVTVRVNGKSGRELWMSP